MGKLLANLFAILIFVNALLTNAATLLTDLATSYPGEEARYRYATLLVQRSRFREAREVFNDMLKRAKVSPSYYRRKEAHWLDAAKRDLAALGPG